MLRHIVLWPTVWTAFLISILHADTPPAAPPPTKTSTPGYVAGYRHEVKVEASPTEGAAVGVKINYQLPTEGPLPKTYRVTLAAVDAKDSNWVISTFAAGVVCTVTAENQGKFTATWDGLDDNFMPVPPGTYGVKGIYMPADKWYIDGEYHSIIPKLAAMAGSWGQSPAEDKLPGKVEGDSGADDHGLTDIDVAQNGQGVSYFRYQENSFNGFPTDFTKPIGYEQISKGYNSGSVGGGLSVCIDGKKIWLLCNVNHPFILHADLTPFGTQSAIGLSQPVYLPEGWVTDLTAWTDPQLGHSVVFVAERGKLTTPNPKKPWRYEESPTDFVNKVVALDDANKAASLATWPVERPISLKARGGKLYVLHGSDGKFEVLALPLTSGWQQAQFSPVFNVPAGITPFDMEIDSHGRVYLSDTAANHIYQFDAQGKPLRTYGKLNAQKDGSYDPNTFMDPAKLGCWTDDKGVDRLLVVEVSGPNRLSEWNGDDGTLIRQWVTPQTEELGYAVDPRHPDHIYMQGHSDTLVRWKVDYTTGQWTTEAVWSHVGACDVHEGIYANKLDPFGGKLPMVHAMEDPRIIYRGDDVYLVFGRGYAIYHLEGDHWRACAALFRIKGEDKTNQFYMWRDLNGDGQVQDNEYFPFKMTSPPVGLTRYLGDKWFDDLSLVCIGLNTPDIWQLSPTSFDSRGTPIYDPNSWKKLLTDNIFVDRKAGKATATHGGNELLTEGFDCTWASVAPAANGDIYVNARSGYMFAANEGAQTKLSRYVPDGKGGYTQRWRVGRIAIQHTALPGEIYGSIFVSPPVNGLVAIVDGWRGGMEVYTEDGLYVDTLLPDIRSVSHDQMGAYWLPGEFFFGYHYANRDNGKVYLALGKTMPTIYEAQGWTTTQNPVHPLTTFDQTVTLPSNAIASPPDIALQVRGGAAAAKVARFYPSPGGGPALDGSMTGWEACDPVQFSGGPTQTIEARCYYDPDHLYIRWHARLGQPFKLQPLLLPEHIFAHDHENDTLSLYLQGDSKAAPGSTKPEGRPGDVRFVFGIFKDGDATRPVVLGMYPTWTGSGATPITYTSAVAPAAFAHVGLVPGVTAGYKIDDDDQGFVIAAAIPRTAIPGTTDLNGWHTEGNFDADLGGHNRFFWSNADGSAQLNTYDEPTEARLYPGSWSPFQFLPINQLAVHSWMAIGPFAFPGMPKLDIAWPTFKDRAELIKRLTGSTFPPDTTRDMTATYDGDLTVTRVSQHHVAWKDVELSADAVKFQQALGWDDHYATTLHRFNYDEGTVYLLTHIHTPEAADVTLQDIYNPHGFSIVSAHLDGKPLPQVTDKLGKAHLDASKPVSLQAGWNELLLRSDVIEGESDLGVSLIADPAVLWKLKISGPVPTGP